MSDHSPIAEKVELGSGSASPVERSNTIVEGKFIKDKPSQTGAIATPSQTEDKSDHLSGLPLIILISGLCLATFFIALDNTILGRQILEFQRFFRIFTILSYCGACHQYSTPFP